MCVYLLAELTWVQHDKPKVLYGDASRLLSFEMWLIMTLPFT